jgi:hypothetical protein
VIFFNIILIYKQMPSFGSKRNGARRRRAAAAAAAAAEEEERLSRSSSSSDEETPKREKSKETIRQTVNPYGATRNTSQSWSERIFGKGLMHRATRNKGSKKKRRRGKRTARRSRRY